MNCDLSYLSVFCDWLQKGKDSGLKGLSKPTFECAIRSCKAILSLVPYLFERYPNLDFILLGNICSDFLEGRFGWWRQLCGGNYYNSVIQFLQAEKTIRIRSPVSMGYDMKEIHRIFNESKKNKTMQQEEEIKLFLDDLDTFCFSDDGVLNDADKSLIYYVAGYIAKSSLNNCEDCNYFISHGKVPLLLEMESTDDIEESAVEAKEAFTAAVSRGGLTKPSDYLYITSVHASALYNHTFKDNELKKSLLVTENPRITFIEGFYKLVENNEFSAPLIHVKCIKGHSHIKYICLHCLHNF